MQGGEWNPAKAASNLEKHNISFRDAVTVFNDPPLVTLDVTKPEHGEVRYIAIGMMHDGDMVTVVFTRRDDKRRIISARKVRKDERRRYDSGKSIARRQGSSGDA